MGREVASKTSDLADDGTATATALAQAIVKEGAKAVAASMNPMDLKSGIDIAVEAVVKDLGTNSKKVTSNDEIAQVSAKGDAEIDRFLAEAMKKVGNGGVITVEEAKSLEPSSTWSRACSSTAATSRPISSPTPTRCASRWTTPRPKRQPTADAGRELPACRTLFQIDVLGPKGGITGSRLIF
jgi:TCP-1/cpn60 chaperonin family